VAAVGDSFWSFVATPSDFFSSLLEWRTGRPHEQEHRRLRDRNPEPAGRSGQRRQGRAAHERVQAVPRSGLPRHARHYLLEKGQERMLTASGAVLQVAEYIDGVGDSANLLVRALQRFAFASLTRTAPGICFASIFARSADSVRSRSALGAPWARVLSCAETPSSRAVMSRATRPSSRDRSAASCRRIRTWPESAACNFGRTRLCACAYASQARGSFLRVFASLDLCSTG